MNRSISLQLHCSRWLETREKSEKNDICVGVFAPLSCVMILMLKTAALKEQFHISGLTKHPFLK